jgi:hypothetical protein
MRNIFIDDNMHTSGISTNAASNVGKLPWNPAKVQPVGTRRLVQTHDFP